MNIKTTVLNQDLDRTEISIMDDSTADEKSDVPKRMY
jgi:hypothetical protein